MVATKWDAAKDTAIPYKSALMKDLELLELTVQSIPIMRIRGGGGGEEGVEADNNEPEKDTPAMVKDHELKEKHRAIFNFAAFGISGEEASDDDDQEEHKSY